MEDHYKWEDKFGCAHSKPWVTGENSDQTKEMPRKTLVTVYPSLIWDVEQSSYTEVKKAINRAIWSIAANQYRPNIREDDPGTQNLTDYIRD